GLPSIRVGYDAVTGFLPKGKRARAVPLTTDAQHALRLAQLQWGTRGYIFSADGLRSPNFHRENQRACERAKIRQVTFHGLRVSAGARWLVQGLGIHEVSKLLGHADIRTTMNHYAGISDATLAKKIALLQSVLNSDISDKVVSVFSDRRSDRAT
ncbi:MAG TPA: hypothetical protein EYN06_10975, partial [Myxococcales bacterium]|nr:hypothetical protein [Myxococcales bacterium]